VKTVYAPQSYLQYLEDPRMAFTSEANGPVDCAALIWLTKRPGAAECLWWQRSMVTAFFASPPVDDLWWTSQASTGTARSSCDSGNSCNEGLARVRSAITLIKRIRYQLFTVTNCWIRLVALRPRSAVGSAQVRRATGRISSEDGSTVGGCKTMTRSVASCARGRE